MWAERIEKTEELRRRQQMGGGQKRIDKQHEKGKMTAYERISYLLDAGSFQPMDSFFRTSEDSASLMKETFLGDGVICGWGKIHGRRVCVASEDFTVIGGTLGEVHARKICELQDLAYDMRMPLILIGDSGGARIEEGILSLSGYGGMFQRHVRASGVIPQIAAIMGPCSGGASYSPALCDFVFMVENLSKMCLTGPAVVESVLGIKTTLEELGSTKVHGSQSGVAHVVCEDEKHCLDSIRTLLTYLPDHCGEEAVKKLQSAHRSPERWAEIMSDDWEISHESHASKKKDERSRVTDAWSRTTDERSRATDARSRTMDEQSRTMDARSREAAGKILRADNISIETILRSQRRKREHQPFEALVPDYSRQAYDIHGVIENILENDSFYEIHQEFAKNAVVGFGIFDGAVLGVVANNPICMGGAIDSNAADKMARFIRFCDCFSIPLLTLVDVPAFFPGPQQEQSGIIRHGAKILYAYSEAIVPKVTLILRKAYGGAFIAMNCKMMSADAVYAWPIAEIAVMGAEGAVKIIARHEIEQAADPQAEYEARKKAYEEQFSNPFLAAEKGYVDEIILPEETVPRLQETFRLLRTKKKEEVSVRRHGNMPL